MKNVVIATFEEYNPRRYSLPWVCATTERGKYDFNTEVGTYTGRKGEAGDLMVFEPQAGQVYSYGRRDYRGSNTLVKHAVWNGTCFVPCDRLGRINGNND